VDIVVVGSGLIGSHLIFLLSRAGHNITAIDENETQIKSIRQNFDVKTIVGNGVAPRILMEANVPAADVVIACTDNDESNIIICFLSKEMGAQKTIARVRNPEYQGYVVGNARTIIQSRKVSRPKTLGINLFVNPEAITTEEIVSVLFDPYIAPASEFAGGIVQMREFRIDNKIITDQPIGKMNFPEPCSIIAMVKSKVAILPGAEDTIGFNDHAYVISKTGAMDTLGPLFSTPTRPPKSVVVLGGDRIGFQIAKKLNEKNVQVKLIESNLERCQEIAKELTKTIVVHGQGIDTNLLIEEGVPRADAFVAATERDEFNILAGQLVSGLGVPQCMVVVNRPEFISLAQGSGIDFAFSAPLLAANNIMRFITYAQVVTTELIAGEQLQVIEYIAEPNSSIAENVLGKVKLPSGAIIGAITHNNDVVFPKPDDRVVTGDHVIIVCVPALSQTVDKLFAK
jgi:trk system potassium uptake protein TrkA